LALLPKHRAEALASWTALVEVMRSFGEYREDGPGGILNRNPTISAALEAAGTAISQLHGLGVSAIT
jgi:hypothetical protein